MFDGVPGERARQARGDVEPDALTVDGKRTGRADQDGVEVELDQFGDFLGDACDTLDHCHECLVAHFRRATVAIEQRGGPKRRDHGFSKAIAR